MGKSKDKKNKKKNKGEGVRTENDVLEVLTSKFRRLFIMTMDTAEVTMSNAVPGILNRKIKKGIQMKRTKKVRKMKAITKAISKQEMKEIKIKKSGVKVSRSQSAKLLYE